MQVTTDHIVFAMVIEINIASMVIYRYATGFLLVRLFFSRRRGKVDSTLKYLY